MSDFKNKQATWLDAIGNPIAGADAPGVGQDPRYGEHFSQIKAQIESKSDADYELILTTAVDVLSQEGKDVRVAGYLWFAATRLHGADGFLFGLQVMSALLTTFADALYPAKPSARQAALNWIAQDRVIHFLESYGNGLTNEGAELLSDAYKTFCEASGAVLEDDFHWTKFSSWLQSQQKSKALPSDAGGASAPATANQAPAEIQSDTQLTQVFRHVATYYRKNKMYGTYASLNRAVRWSDLKMPPADDGITRVAAPPNSDQAKIENLMEQGQWMDAWLACEDAFMNPGGLFYLEYQRIAHQCAQMVGLGEVTYAIEAQLSGLLRRLPKLTSLRFADESPFASSRMLGWVEQTLTASSNDSDGSVDYLSQARDVARTAGITAALKWLAEQPSAGTMERIRLSLMQGQLCVENDQSALALPLLKRLSDELLEYRLPALDPALALQVWRQLQFALEHQLRRTRGADDKAAIKQQLQQVNHQICSTDITMASQWL